MEPVSFQIIGSGRRCSVSYWGSYMHEDPPERKCPFCGSALDGVSPDASGEYKCVHCRSVGRYEGRNLTAIDIPGYHMRLKEMEDLDKDITEEIGLETLRGPGRNMEYLQRKNRERQMIQSEQAFLAHFQRFVEKW